MNAHNKMWQKQYRNISDVSEQENLQYLKYSQWGRSWRGQKMVEYGVSMFTCTWISKPPMSPLIDKNY